MRRTWGSVFLSILMSGLYGAPAQTAKPIRHINISSASMGWISSRTELSIYKAGDSYLLQGHPVESSLIDDLSKALAQPINPNPVPGDLGITPEWLRSNAIIFTSGKAIWLPAPTSDQESLFESMFVDPATIQSALLPLYAGFHTDDSPLLQAVIIFEDNTRMVVSSSSQHAFMLPWRVDRGGTQEKAWNADISRAFTALMPDESTNRVRISGVRLADELAHQVKSLALQRSLANEVQTKAGTSLKALDARYSTTFSRIIQNDTPNWEWDRTLATPPRPVETDIHLTLHPLNAPANFTEDVVFQFQDAKALGVRTFLHEAARYESLVLSVPWLSAFLQQSPAETISLSFVHNASLTDTAMAAFSADMHVIGKDELAAQVQQARPNVALLLRGRTLSQSTWLVLPDHRVILWKDKGFGNFLKWKKADFTFKPCAGPSSPFGSCAGAEISADGVITR